MKTLIIAALLAAGLTSGCASSCKNETGSNYMLCNSVMVPLIAADMAKPITPRKAKVPVILAQWTNVTVQLDDGSVATGVVSQLITNDRVVLPGDTLKLTCWRNSHICEIRFLQHGRGRPGYPEGDPRYGEQAQMSIDVSDDGLPHTDWLRLFKPSPVPWSRP